MGELSRRLDRVDVTDDRMKKRFGFMLVLWLRGPLRAVVQCVNDERRPVEAGHFRCETAHELQKEHANGKVVDIGRLWMVFNLEVFWRHCFEQQSTQAIEDWIACRRAQT